MRYKNNTPIVVIGGAGIGTRTLVEACIRESLNNKVMLIQPSDKVRRDTKFHNLEEMTEQQLQKITDSLARFKKSNLITSMEQFSKLNKGEEVMYLNKQYRIIGMLSSSVNNILLENVNKVSDVLVLHSSELTTKDFYIVTDFTSYLKAERLAMDKKFKKLSNDIKDINKDILTEIR